ncbi:MAG: right-handed parallel beta-helix repeat-containing protein [Anaerolineae bacterium]|nr:right-handed parallel beta-helix repeat-containing protein [Anaerolineae bacterium]
MATYYVATNGNDGNNGTSTSTPFATFQKAANIAAAGDTVLVRVGTYNQTVEISNSGSSGNPITFDAYPGSGTREAVVLDGEELLPTGAYKDGSTGQYPGGYRRGYVTGAMVLISGSYVIWKNIDVINGRGTGIRCQKRGDTNRANCSNHTFENVTSRNHRWTTFEAKNTSDLTLTNVALTQSGMYAPFQRDGTYIVNGVIVARCPWPPATSIDADDVTLTGCTIYENWGEGCGFAKSRNVNLADCVVYDNWRLNMYFNSVEGGSATRCLCYYTDNNQFEISKNNYNADGLVFNNEGGNSQENFDTKDIVVSNCIFVNSGRSLAIWGGQIAGVMENIEVYHNTFINAQREGVRYLNGQVTRTGFVIKNNIFLQTNGVDLESGGASCDDITWDNNLWWDGSGGMPHANMRGANDVYADPILAKVQAALASGQVDPRWYAINDAGSPAIGAGATGTGVADDYFEGTRGSPPDIGAHEYGASSPSGTITAAFSASATSGVGTLTAQFVSTSTSTSGIDTYQYQARLSGGDWFTFGAAADVTFTFAAGTYDVRLIVTGVDGSDTSTKTGYIVVAEDVGEGPGTPAGGGSADVYYSLTRVAAAMSSGEQEINLNCDFTPNALMIWLTKATTDGSAADHASICIGAWDGTNQWVVAAGAADNVGTSNTMRRSYSTDVIFLMQDGSTSADARATVSSVGAGLLTLNWSNGADGAYLMHILALNVIDPNAGHFTLNSSVAGTTSVSGFDAEPDVIVLAHMNNASVDSSASTARYGVGWAVNGSGQCAAGIEWDDAAGTATGNCAVSDAYAAIKSTDAGVQWGAEISFDATGFTATTREGTGGFTIFYLSWNQGGRGAWADVVDTPTATGAQAYTAPSMRAGAVLMAPSMVEGIDVASTDAKAGVFGLIASTIDLTYTNVISNDMGAGTTDTKSFADNAVTVPLDDGSAGIAGGGVTLNPDGFGVTFTAVTATAKKWPALVLEAPAERQDDWFQLTLRKTLRVGLP